MNCEEKNYFSGFFMALAIQINQRSKLLLNTNLYVKHKNIFLLNIYFFNISFKNERSKI